MSTENISVIIVGGVAYPGHKKEFQFDGTKWTEIGESIPAHNFKAPKPWTERKAEEIAKDINDRIIKLMETPIIPPTHFQGFFGKTRDLDQRNEIDRLNRLVADKNKVIEMNRKAIVDTRADSNKWEFEASRLSAKIAKLEGRPSIRVIAELTAEKFAKDQEIADLKNRANENAADAIKWELTATELRACVGSNTQYFIKGKQVSPDEYIESLMEKLKWYDSNPPVYIREAEIMELKKEIEELKKQIAGDCRTSPLSVTRLIRISMISARSITSWLRTITNISTR